MLVKQVKGLELAKESNVGERLLLNNGCLWLACFIIGAVVSLFSSQMWKGTDLESRLDPDDLHTQVKRKYLVLLMSVLRLSMLPTLQTTARKDWRRHKGENIDVESQNLLRVQHKLISLLLRERERPFRSVFFSLKQAHWLGELSYGSRNFVKL